MKRPFFPFVFILIAAVGNWVIYQIEVSSAPIIVSQIAAPEYDGRTLTDNFVSPDDDKFLYTFERPIFSPGRRPFVASYTWLAESEPMSRGEQVHANTLEDSEPDDLSIGAGPPELSVVGVSVGPQVARALVVESLSPNPSWFEVGMDIDDWTISQIDSGGLSLKRDGRQIRYDMYPSSGDDAHTNSE